ncbi:hypothetical protein KBA01_26640 [Kozakia baliensis]|nr:hypothetical protein KBA01_26640 [Kozakia baliensis]
MPPNRSSTTPKRNRDKSTTMCADPQQLRSVRYRISPFGNLRRRPGKLRADRGYDTNAAPSGVRPL